MGNMATEKEPQPKVDGQPAPKLPPTPAPVVPKGDGEAAKMFKTKKGYANWYFNELERDKLLAEFKKHGDFSAVGGTWVAEGKYQRGDQPGDLRFEVTETKEDADPIVRLKLNIEDKLAPLKDLDIVRQREPIGSGGLMMALYHYHRLLTVGGKGFEGEFAHGGHEPFYPYPADGMAPKSLAVASRGLCGTTNQARLDRMQVVLLAQGPHPARVRDVRHERRRPVRGVLLRLQDRGGPATPAPDRGPLRRQAIRGSQRQQVHAEQDKLTRMPRRIVAGASSLTLTTMTTRYVIPICAAIVAAVLAPTHVVAADPLNELAESTNKKLVKLFGAGGFSRLNNFGTGIIISKDGYMLTVASQLLDTSDLVVHLYDGQRMKAQVVVVEPELDAAIIKIRAEGKKLEDPIGLDLDLLRLRRGRQTPARYGRRLGARIHATRSRSRCATSR